MFQETGIFFQKDNQHANFYNISELSCSEDMDASHSDFLSLEHWSNSSLV